MPNNKNQDDKIDIKTINNKELRIFPINHGEMVIKIYQKVMKF